MSNPLRIPCFQCAYYHPTDRQKPGPSEVGQCHRHAPIALLPVPLDAASPPNYSPIMRVWPPVGANDTCGDFERSQY